MTPEEKEIEKMFQNHYKEQRAQLIDDMIVYGCAQSKTSIADCKVVFERIEPDEQIPYNEEDIK